MSISEKLSKVIDVLNSIMIDLEASNNDTKTSSEEIGTKSEELRSPTKNTKPERSEKQVSAYKENFQKRWSKNNKQDTSIYDEII